MTSAPSIDPDASGVIVDADRYTRAMEQYVLLTGRSMEDAMMHEGRQLVRALVRSMPPHRTPWYSDDSGHAKRRAERRVAGALRRMFIGKDLVGSRRVTRLFGKEVRGAPWIVPAPERHPDVEGIYDRESGEVWRSGESTHRRIKAGKVRYVDRRKLTALKQREWKKIGRMAAGYVPAAARFGTPVPAWIRRHRVGGWARIDFRPDVLRIEVVNAHPKASRNPGLQRRADLAVRARIEAIEKQVPYLLRRHERLVSGS
jgi:hypothetical protein